MKPSPDLGRRLRAALLAVLLASGLGLTACTSDDAGGGATAASGGRQPGTTSDPGSRYMDAAGPLGGLTQETPPVFVPPEGPVTSR